MLILVVGPSGAGKDTILNAARRALSGDTNFRFVRRVITRPAEPDGENHQPVSEAQFAALDFALQWRAHGLSYGIPVDVMSDLSQGVTVIANVSRGVIAEADGRFPTRVIEITAPPEILARRLAARGRETAADIAGRLGRTVPLPDHVRLDRIMNDTTPEAATARFIQILKSAARRQPA